MKNDTSFLSNQTIIRLFSEQFSFIIVNDEHSKGEYYRLKTEMRNRTPEKKHAALDTYTESLEKEIRNSLTGPSKCLTFQNKINSVMTMRYLQLIDLYIPFTPIIPKEERVIQSH